MVQTIKLGLLIFFIAYASAANLVKDLLQYNVFGIPVLHKEVSWPFDPDVGVRRSRQYQELNGKHGEKAIERLGLGIDGYDRERLEQQRKRDEGHLGGLNNFTP